MRHKGSGSATEDRQFNAALLELFLHEFLQGTGASVLVDPEIGGLTPDFKVTEQLDTGQQIDYVVEATDIEVGRNSELEIPWIERAALDVLNEIESPDFYLHVETSGALGSMPSKRSLKSPFEQLLKDTDYDRGVISGKYQLSPRKQSPARLIWRGPSGILALRLALIDRHRLALGCVRRRLH
jgi:hypothetical protein